MQNETSQAINRRFFEAFDALVARGDIKNQHAFCVDNQIDRRNFDRLRSEPQREFQLSFLWLLVTKFGVSANWLITGRGKIFK